ncbi:MAG: enoyl-CoA hydratase-related protein [Candidatus Brevundimonas phytovorans]|nr:enoyl-CoA hydratase-related protein [Brevundimonas sp.]WEK57985.1 MAG: enoyl-CoA hydratase-related protein [Brevundimonas sp.]
MIGFERKGEGAIIRLDQPERMNALSEPMMEALDAAVDAALASGARALMLTGAGRAFCAGGALSAPLPDDAGLILETHINPLLLKLADLPIPLIAAVNGPAIGAGASIALAADMILMSRSAFLSYAFAQVGLAPDSGASWLLPRTLGWHRALGLMMTGERITAEQAVAWGLAWKAVDPEALSGEAEVLLERLSNGPTLAYAAARRTARAALDLGFAQALDVEREAQADAGRTADFQEGAAAFGARRPARFVGR